MSVHDIPVPDVPDEAHTEFWIVKYRCACGRQNECVAFPWHGIEAKHRCGFCNRPNIVKTRSSAMEYFDERSEITKDHVRVSKRHSVHLTPERIREECEIVRRKLTPRRRVLTSMGPATLIG